MELENQKYENIINQVMNLDPASSDEDYKIINQMKMEKLKHVKLMDTLFSLIDDEDLDEQEEENHLDGDNYGINSQAFDKIEPKPSNTVVPVEYGSEYKPMRNPYPTKSKDQDSTIHDAMLNHLQEIGRQLMPFKNNDAPNLYPTPENRVSEFDFNPLTDPYGYKSNEEDPLTELLLSHLNYFRSKDGEDQEMHPRPSKYDDSEEPSTIYPRPAEISAHHHTTTSSGTTGWLRE